MVVTFNDEISATRIFTYSGAYSANLSASTAFDYFPDAAAIGNIVYFGYWRQFKDIKVYVGTALAAASVTIAWEYYDISTGWTALAGVTDGTNAFQNTGQNWVTFTVPDNWRSNSINSATLYWVRARITAINTPTEGGAQSTQVVKLGNNAISVDNGTHTFTDIYNADVAAGWGLVTNVGNYFLFTSHLIVGKGTNTTDLTDSNKLVQIGTPTIRREWSVGVKGTLQMGDLSNGTYTTDYGCNGGSIVCYSRAYIDNIVYYNNSAGNLKLYGCSVYNSSIYNQISSITDIRNCILNGSSLFFTVLAGSKLYRCTTNLSGTYGLMVYNSNLAILDVIMENPDRGILNGWAGYTTTLTDCKFNSTLASHINMGSSGANYFKLYNCNWDEAKLSSSVNAATLSEYYTLGLKVVDSSNNPIASANVAITNSVGALVTKTTDANGDIVATDLLVATYTRSSGVMVKTNYNPFTIVITKAGYATYTTTFTVSLLKRNFVITLGNFNTGLGRMVQGMV